VADAATVFESDIGQLDWHFGAAEARRVNQPALVVLGSESPTLNPRFEETYQTLLDWLPKAEGFMLPGATHFLQLKNPPDMGEALAAFFGRHAMTLENGSGSGAPIGA
jgi:pimeloyl-ACP methyl ester carboxylesterase